MIPESFIQELLARIDIVDVVERYVPLKKGGANYQACCPFHSEKTPSFTVSPSKQFYHCFGCGAHGSAIGFLMQYSGLGFVDAVEELAHSLGMQVPRTDERPREREAKTPLTEWLARAARFYREQLKVSPHAIDYLKRRGLTGEIAARYGIGYAPDAWQGLAAVFADYGDPALIESGLVIENDQGRRYDRFRDRIMFPIFDGRGNVIGFGGRVIDQGEPKYLNSPETPLFEKGRELYGLPQARRAIRDADAVIVVEGYMDVVGLAQLGVENVVASLGTATTGHHVQKLFKQTSRIVFCFDRDQAGDRAAWRAVEASLEYLADNRSVEILQMPGDQDPDEFIRARGREAFLMQAKQATRLSEFLVRELKKRSNPYTAEGRAQLIHDAKPLLQRLAAPILRAQLTRTLAGLAGLAPAEVENQCGLKPLARRSYAPPPRSRSIAISQARTLLRAILRRPERAARLPLELLGREKPEERAVLAIADAIDHGELSVRNLGLLLEYFRGSEHEAIIGEHAAGLSGDPRDEGEEEAEFNDTLERLRRAALTAEIEALNVRARNGGLSGEEQARLAELLAAKARRTVAGGE